MQQKGNRKKKREEKWYTAKHCKRTHMHMHAPVLDACYCLSQHLCWIVCFFSVCSSNLPSLLQALILPPSSLHLLLTILSSLLLLPLPPLIILLLLLLLLSILLYPQAHTQQQQLHI